MREGRKKGNDLWGEDRIQKDTCVFTGNGDGEGGRKQRKNGGYASMKMRFSHFWSSILGSTFSFQMEVSKVREESGADVIESEAESYEYE